MFNFFAFRYIMVCRENHNDGYKESNKESRRKKSGKESCSGQGRRACKEGRCEKGSCKESRRKKSSQEGVVAEGQGSVPAPLFLPRTAPSSVLTSSPSAPQSFAQYKNPIIVFESTILLLAIRAATSFFVN